MISTCFIIDDVNLDKLIWCLLGFFTGKFLLFSLHALLLKSKPPSPAHTHGERIKFHFLEGEISKNLDTCLNLPSHK